MPYSDDRKRPSFTEAFRARADKNRFSAWILERMKQVDRVYTTGEIHLRTWPGILKRLRSMRFNDEDCHFNALRVSAVDQEIRYVEGFVDPEKPHAWNSYRGLHFDVTFEALNAGNVYRGFVYNAIR